MKIIQKSILIIIGILVPASAIATNYECNTEHVLLWKDSKLMPQDETFNGVHDIFHFNGETGDLWSSPDKNAFLNPMPFKIIKKMISDNELFAIYDGGDDKWNAGSSFRINVFDKNEMAFLFDSTAEPAIFTGKCHVYTKRIPHVVRDGK